MKFNLITIIFSLILLLIISCEKKTDNEIPIIRFIYPDNNMTISNDTIISLIVEAYDIDGTIDRVEFIKNGTTVQTVKNPPYKFDWHISTESNLGVFFIKAIAYDNQQAKSETESPKIEIKSFLTHWLGFYEGNSHHWISYDEIINGQWQNITNNYYKRVNVNVIKSSQDSCLDFAITYDDSIIVTQNGLKFSVTGIHKSSWGGGSGFGYLNINLNSDTLKYIYFQQCGIPCSSGIDFVINKK